ncbi:hypothetical protein BT67DRAFT_155773 [Trichocladium antarcticum]|uniref:Uncharacterized protein n=1 Tax=Trichocladium antarcticum TaxID=1450529 RepID=A0AAN6UEY6_9PEZI|nr:hypothetical protein BT67DRAFT_155773 [Trichocladium antarcticum]
MALSDPEKQAPASPQETETFPARSDLSTSTLEGPKATKEINHSEILRHSRSHSHSSHSSLDSNPLSPLEHALGNPLSTADIEPADSDNDDNNNDTPLDLNLARTRTSIASAASRPPDFEVTLEHDDPENPRNWHVYFTFIFCIFVLSWSSFFLRFCISCPRCIIQPDQLTPTTH